MTLPIWKRKHDLIYLIFFLTHIPIMFCKSLFFSARTANNRLAMHVEIDVSDMNARCRPYTLYPAALKPAFMTNLRAWYITTYRDQFFSSPP